jgi:hypothetical protein
VIEDGTVVGNQKKWLKENGFYIQLVARDNKSWYKSVTVTAISTDEDVRQSITIPMDQFLAFYDVVIAPWRERNEHETE